jgi:hypothetical protein
VQVNAIAFRRRTSKILHAQPRRCFRRLGGAETAPSRSPSPSLSATAAPRATSGLRRSAAPREAVCANVEPPAVPAFQKIGGDARRVRGEKRSPLHRRGACGELQRRHLEQRTRRTTGGLRHGPVDSRGFAERAHARVLELDDLASRIDLQRAKALEHGRRVRATEPLPRLKCAVRRAAEARVQRQRALVGDERAGAVALLKTALPDVVRRKRIVRPPIGDR